jgi:hypothetical protein
MTMGTRWADQTEAQRERNREAHRKWARAHPERHQRERESAAYLAYHAPRRFAAAERMAEIQARVEVRALEVIDRIQEGAEQLEANLCTKCLVQERYASPGGPQSWCLSCFRLAQRARTGLDRSSPILWLNVPGQPRTCELGTPHLSRAEQIVRDRRRRSEGRTRRMGLQEIRVHESLMTRPNGRAFCFRCKCDIDPGQLHPADGGMQNDLARTEGHDPPLAWAKRMGLRQVYVYPEHWRCNAWGLREGNLPASMMPRQPRWLHLGHGCKRDDPRAA